MISRRTILSRSCDDHDLNDIYDTDVWFNVDKLIQNHIQEVLMKWEQIDDEIWAKIICMERNRRVAKAYARAPILTINGCDNGFDGYRIGLNGFDNPMRDPKTEDVKRQIGSGVKVKMDQDGNILVKRCSKTNVYVKGWHNAVDNTGEGTGSCGTSVSNEIIKANGLLDVQKSLKLFDMKKFQNNVYRELKSAYPDRRRLEEQCISFIAFVRDANDVLDVPVWVMIINIVALDMLKSKLPPITENPYSTVPSDSSAGSKSTKSSDKSRPPRLPPRDVLGKRAPINLPKPDYDANSENDFGEEDRGMKMANRMAVDRSGKKIENPYYSGFSARVPDFAKRSATSGQSAVKGEPPVMKKSQSKGFLSKAHRSGSHHDLTYSDSTDPFLSRMNGNHSISSGYISGSNTNTLRSDSNDIYGVNHKYLQNRYPFNLKPNQMSSIQMAMKFSPRGRGYVVGDWE